ncbi:tyrosine recombinase XerD [Lederbergia ruris]|uniref:Tyrosine recombinase XerD n=1 Tax=Lederbergia ruris TaxID=217495 RepID=A0ABQ4KKR8_9BACI|nr:site-specific integrase [Lederbergia ruris]GIN58477.1 tyrosine recombinase XerD [Lederbergia ruris]
MSSKRKRKYFEDEIFSLKDAKELILKIKMLDGVTDLTLRAYKLLFNDFEKFFGNDVDVKSLTVDDARDYIFWQLHEKEPYSNSSRRNKKGEKGVSIRTANNYLILAQSVFNVLEKEGITFNIFSSIKKIKEHEKMIETLTTDEINKLFRTFNKKNYVEFRNYVACHLMLDAYSRVSETLNIRRSDIDFKRKSVTFKRTKNKKIRTVPLSNETLKLLRELIKENEDFDSEYVFLTIFGEPLDDATFRKNLYEVAERAEIKKNVYPHIFRHTASKMFIEQGGSIRILQTILGHASVETTERYAHVLDQTIENYHEHFSPIKKLKKKSKTRTSRQRR